MVKSTMTNLVLTAKSSSITDRDYITRMILKTFPDADIYIKYSYCHPVYMFRFRLLLLCIIVLFIFTCTICTLSRCGLST